MNIDNGDKIKQILYFVESQINQNLSSSYYGGIYDYPGACSYCYYSFASGWFILAVDAYNKLNRDLAVNENINLFAQAIDENALDWAWLSTNESGVWRNYTNAYGSPLSMGGAANSWKWSTFSWKAGYNTADKTIGWRIWYNNSLGTENKTDILTFHVQKVGTGSPCSQSSQCLSGYCVHKVCRSSSTYCGDSYCDTGEDCSSCHSDCGFCSTPKPIVSVSKDLNTVDVSILSLKPSEPKVVDVSQSDTALTEIYIKVNKKLENVKITIEKLNEKPADIATVAGIPYNYLSITKENIENEDVSTAIIKFKVEKSWIDENNINENSIALNRYNNGWDKLPTTKLEESSDYVYYQSETSGFSYFAITGENKTAITTTTTTTVPQEKAIQFDLKSIAVTLIIILVAAFVILYYRFA